MIEVVPATLDHAALIAADTRRADIEELWATSFASPKSAMMRGIEASEEVKTGLVDGLPVCMFGVVEESLVGHVGIPWMVGTNLLDKHALAFLRRNNGWIYELMQRYNYLVNHVDARNAVAIKWLRWLGFTIEEPEPYGVLDKPFHKFWMRRKPCVGQP